MPELIDIARRIAEQARGDEQIEAYVSWNRGTEIRAFEGEVESLSSAESAGVGIRVIKDSRQGFAYVGDLDERHAREALEEARDNASFASIDEHVGLAEPDGVTVRELELWNDELAGFGNADKIALALELERQVRAGDERIRQVVSADYGDSSGESAIASSKGIAVNSRETTCFLSADVVAGAGDDTQTGSGYSVGRGPRDIDVNKAARDAVERATRLLGAVKPTSARLVVVFDPRITATLLSILANTLSGEEVERGRSLFADRIGEEVATSTFSLVDDPTDIRAFGASAVDSEGLACRRNVLIEAGRLSRYLYDSYSSRVAGTVSTGSAVRGGYKSIPGVGARALALSPGDLDQNGIIASVGEGLLIQGISGVHSGVNRVSGDFSVGAEGIMFRNGQLAEPVREITIASTIQKILQNVLHIGNDVDWLPSSASGVSLAIDDFAMSGA